MCIPYFTRGLTVIALVGSPQLVVFEPTDDWKKDWRMTRPGWPGLPY
jgi:hypothetical protein